MSFSVLPWQLWATRLLCSWENLTKWTLLAQEPLPCRFSDRLDVYFWGGKIIRRIPFAEMPDKVGVSKNLEKKTIISSPPNDQSGRLVLTLYSLRGRRSKGKGRLASWVLAHFPEQRLVIEPKGRLAYAYTGSRTGDFSWWFYWDSPVFKYAAVPRTHLM